MRFRRMSGFIGRICAVVVVTIAFSGVLALTAMTPEARRSFEAFERKAESGDPEAQYRLSVILERGFDTIPADTVRSLRLLRSSAQAGFAPAQNYLGFLYGQGEMVEANPDSARYWIRRAADGGDPKAAYNLAYMLLDDRNRETSPRDSAAVRYLTIAVDAGLPQAMTKLADIYSEGRLVSPDTVKAVELYGEAIERGFADAELRLLNLMGPVWRKLNSEESLRLALEYWNMGAYAIGAELAQQVGPAEPETARAYALLGHAYSRGQGVPYSHHAANEYFARAALMGNPSAQFILAETLEIFPDALADLIPASDASISGPKTPESLTPESLTPETLIPESLRAAAAAAGITTAEAAARAITAPRL